MDHVMTAANHATAGLNPSPVETTEDPHLMSNNAQPRDPILSDAEIARHLSSSLTVTGLDDGHCW